MYENQNQGYVLDWDSAIEKDAPDFILLKEGDYDFEITNFERQRHNGSQNGKLPPCPKAVVTLHIEGVDKDGNPGVTNISHNLFLHSSCESLLSSFFAGIGRKRKGERLVMDWSNLIGVRGYAHIGVREWTGKDGEPKYSNEVKRFYTPEEALLRKAKVNTPPAFQTPPTASQSVPQRAQTTQVPWETQPTFTPGNF
nr:MAG TPA: Protein of unknown function (DUF669) [Caudoviricetes sp.]